MSEAAPPVSSEARLRRVLTRSRLISFAFFLASIVAIMLLPSFVSAFRAQQFAYVGIYLIALLGLQLLTGITGQISLGHGAFMLIGGYVTAILISDEDPPLEILGHQFTGDMKDLWTIPLAGLVAGLAGFLFGFPALRLTGLYLALATFAIAVAMPSVIKRYEHVTGGGPGINLLESPQLTGVSRTDPVTFEQTPEGVHFLGITIGTFNDWLYFLSWSIAIVLFAVAWLLLQGRFGRSLRAVRDSELAAASSGVNLARYKTLAFGISAFYAGVAGSLLAIATTFVNPDTFPVALSIFLLVGVVVGGLGSLWPLVFGAIFIHFMQIEWAQRIEDVIPNFIPVLGDIDTDATGAPAVGFGVVLILIMLAFPGGAAGLLVRLKSLATRGYGRVR
jgi:branched-chain amino acid transport system permease protein